MRLIMALCLLFITHSTYANTIVKGSVVCISEESLDQFSEAITVKDSNAMKYLLKNECLILKEDVNATLLDVGVFAGLVKARVYTDEGAVIIWTSIINVSTGNH